MQQQKKEELIRVIKFVLFSASAGLIEILSATLFLEVFKFDAWLAHLISLILSVLWNFTINRKFTFKSANNVPIAMLKVALFYVVFTPLSTWWTKVLTSQPISWNEYVVIVATMLINFVLEFLYWRFFVFAKSINTAETKKEEKKEE